MSGDHMPLEYSHQAPIIGYHRAPLTQKFGAPRQPNLVAVISIIEMVAPYDTPAAFEGLDDFSHIWISWQFHHNYRDKDNNQAHDRFRAQVRPPRLGGNQKIGVFASRSMYRPSALGLSVVRLERVAIVQGRVLLIVNGADMIDGTPIIDIKPYVAYSDALEQAKSGFASTTPLPADVTMTKAASEQCVALIEAQQKTVINGDTENSWCIKDMPKNATVALVCHQIQNQLVAADIDIIKALIAQDPRPAYRRTDTVTVFVMRYKSVDVSFRLINLEQLQITSVVAV